MLKWEDMPSHKYLNGSNYTKWILLQLHLLSRFFSGIRISLEDNEFSWIHPSDENTNNANGPRFGHSQSVTKIYQQFGFLPFTRIAGNRITISFLLSIPSFLIWLIRYMHKFHWIKEQKRSVTFKVNGLVFQRSHRCQYGPFLSLWLPLRQHGILLLISNPIRFSNRIFFRFTTIFYS